MNNDNITQAAANKEAEEGGLPNGGMHDSIFVKVWGDAGGGDSGRRALANYAFELGRASRQVAEKVTCGFCKGTGDGEIGLHGCTDCNGKGYFWEPVEDEVASRQVANKAEVEPVQWVRKATDELSLPELAEQFAAVEALGCDYTLSAKVCGKLFRAMTTQPDATPPATTGASTVLTDERIMFEHAERESDLTRDGEGEDYANPCVQSAWEGWQARAKVAAQAGQVAVPEWISVEERVPGEQGQDSEEVLCFLSGHCAMTDFECRDGAGWGIRLGYYDADKGMFRTGGRPDASVTHWMSLPAAPSPAKESK